MTRNWEKRHGEHIAKRGPDRPGITRLMSTTGVRRRLDGGRSDLTAGEAADRAEVERGKYLVTLGGCIDCHTPGYFFGKPDMNRFSAAPRSASKSPAWVFPRTEPDTRQGNRPGQLEREGHHEGSARACGRTGGSLRRSCRGARSPLTDTDAQAIAISSRACQPSATRCRARSGRANADLVRDEGGGAEGAVASKKKGGRGHKRAAGKRRGRVMRPLRFVLLSGR